MPATYRFQEIGPIKDATLQLGDITIIAGRNNTGKTYLAYTLYGFIQSCRAVTDHTDLLIPGLDETDIFRDLIQSIQSADESGVVEYSLDQTAFFQQRQKFLELLSKRFSGGLFSYVFSTRSDEFLSSRIDANLTEEDSFRPQEFNWRISDRVVLSIKTDGITLHTVVTYSSRDDLGRRVLAEIVAQYIQFLVRIEFPAIFILSSERFGISLFYRELDFTKHQLVDLLQELGDDRNRTAAELPYSIIDRSTSRYTLPIKDNIDYTRGISERQRQKSELADIKAHSDIKNMMNGYYRFSDNEIRFVSKSRGKGKFSIPLHLASSSARGLSDFYFFLQHDAECSGLVIIDEPESHLDTKNQVVMARLLIKLVHAGVKILITTHSDYLIKEFNNLIMLSNAIKKHEGIAEELKYDPSVALDPNSVRAYVAEDGGLKECMIDRYGIDMPVFDTTIDEMNRVSNKLVFLAGESDE